MKSMEITAVGIDVSKRKSTVAIRRPGGVIVACPFDISHSSHDLEKLVSILKTTGGDIRVVMEHTSNYWKPYCIDPEKCRLLCFCRKRYADSRF